LTPEKSNALTIHDHHFSGGVVTRRSASAWVPDLVAAAGPRATDAYIEFFTATIRNRNTRLAYARACYQFFHWARENGLTLDTVRPFHVAAYIEQNARLEADHQTEAGGHPDAL
jgi:hypothetical protein